MTRLVTSGMRRCALLFVPVLLLALVFGPASQTSAHPLGNFTVNQYVRIEVTEDSPRLVYVLDLAEIPTLQLSQSIDTNRDGIVDPAEADAFAQSELRVIGEALEFSVGGDVLELVATQPEVTFATGQAGLQVMRLRAVFVPLAPLLITGGNQQIALTNTYETDRLGWREIVVTNGPGIVLSGIELPAGDASRELTEYPSDLLASPLDQTSVSFGITRKAGVPAAASYAGFQREAAIAGTMERPNSGATGGRFASLLERDHLSRTGMLLAILAAALWGAAHAMSPGHGKTVVGAYLVGSKGTPRHALFLGLTVTITHTAGVITLGLVTLFASRYVLPETIFPWLSVLSGSLVVAMGLWTLQMRLRGVPIGHHHHHHDHSHEHDHDHSHEQFHRHDHDHVHSHDGHTHTPPADLSWRSLLALGVSGGLIPCPSALLVLLGSVALGRVGFGLTLVVAFSLGLAATLTGIGVLFLVAGRLFERRIGAGGRLAVVLRFAPAVGSVALTVAGIAIIVRALGDAGLR